MSTQEDAHKEKIACFEEYMKGDHALLHLDSRAEDVQVPAQLKDNPNLTLKVSYKFQGETKHDSHAISVYLKFSGHYQLCVLPWSAIWGISGEDEQNKIWPREVPAEVLKTLAVSKLKALNNALFSKKKVEEEPAARTAPDLKIVDKGRKAPALKRIK